MKRTVVNACVNGILQRKKRKRFKVFKKRLSYFARFSLVNLLSFFYFFIKTWNDLVTTSSTWWSLLHDNKFLLNNHKIAVIYFKQSHALKFFVGSILAFFSPFCISLTHTRTHAHTHTRTFSLFLYFSLSLSLFAHTHTNPYPQTMLS